MSHVNSTFLLICLFSSLKLSFNLQTIQTPNTHQKKKLHTLFLFSNLNHRIFHMEPILTESPKPDPTPSPPPQPLSRYESQKRRDWNTFLQYLRNHKPPLTLTRCSGAHVLEFLKYLDQFGKTKVHVSTCPFFGHPDPPSSCSCPHKQAWGSLDALIGRLRAAYEENGGRQDSNPFAARAIRIYLREVKESQAKARGFPYKKKKRKRQTNNVRLDVKIAGDDGNNGGSPTTSGAVLPLG